MNKKIFLLINCIVSMAILIVLFKKFDLSIAIGKIMTSDLQLILFAVLISTFFRLFLFSFFWQRTLNSIEKAAKYWDIFRINAIALPMKYILPFKINELARAAGLKIFAHIPFSSGVSSLVFIRILAIISTAIWFAIGILLTGKLTYFWLVLTVIVIGFVIVVFFSNIPDGIKINNLFGSFIIDFSQIIKKSRKEDLFTWYFFQAGEIISCILLFKAIGLGIPLNQILYYIPLMMLISSLPVSIQGIGLREGFLILSMTALGSEESLLAIGLLITFVHHLLPALLGLVVWSISLCQRTFVLNIVQEKI